MKKVLALVAVLALAAPIAATAATPRKTLGDVENEVMCPVCGTPLNVAELAPGRPRARLHPRRGRPGQDRRTRSSATWWPSTAPTCSRCPSPPRRSTGPCTSCPRSSCSRRLAPCSCSCPAGAGAARRRPQRRPPSCPRTTSSGSTASSPDSIDNGGRPGRHHRPGRVRGWVRVLHLALRAAARARLPLRGQRRLGGRDAEPASAASRRSCCRPSSSASRSRSCSSRWA